MVRTRAACAGSESDGTSDTDGSQAEAGHSDSVYSDPNVDEYELKAEQNRGIRGRPRKAAGRPFAKPRKQQAAKKRKQQATAAQRKQPAAPRTRQKKPRSAGAEFLKAAAPSARPWCTTFRQ
jgi:hypothetical protein